MDRFIGLILANFKQGDWYLKSNMDRFIEGKEQGHCCICGHLKSNMDRFIEWSLSPGTPERRYLKSNMDRFIESKIVKTTYDTLI